MNAPGTRKRTTLAQLERHVSVQRKSGSPRPRGMAAPLAGDVLAQIDLLKGRVKKRGLFALIEPRRNGTRPVAAARAYDAGAPIQSAGCYAEAVALSLGTESGSWRTFTYNSDDDPATTAFAVEVFDAEAPTFSQAVAPEPPAYPGPVVESSPAAPELPATPASTVEIPVATALSLGQREDGMLGLDLSGASTGDREDAEQFEREIQAILSGRTTRPVPQATSAPSTPEPAATPPSPAPRPHDVFEQMGQNMAYATAFNLPAMELRRRFEDIEREIAREEAAELPSIREVSLELSDEDLAANLAVPLRQSPSAAPPDIVVTPVQQPAAPAVAVPSGDTVEPVGGGPGSIGPPPVPDASTTPPLTTEKTDPAPTGRPTS